MAIFRSLNIPGLVGTLLGGQAAFVTLTKITPGNRSPTNLAGGTIPSSRNYAARGYVSDYASGQVDGTMIQRGDRCVVIYASTLSVVPEPGDRVTVDGVGYALIRVEDRDPAGARYVCQVRA